MNSSAFFSFRYGRIVCSHSKLASILISLPKLHSFVAVLLFLVGTAHQAEVVPVLGGRSSERSHLCCCTPAVWKPLNWGGQTGFTYPPHPWWPSADQPSELLHLYLGTGMVAPAISQCSRHHPEMSVGSVDDRGALNSAVKM